MNIVVDLEGDLPGERSQQVLLSSNEHVVSMNAPSVDCMPAPHPMPESQTQDSYFDDQLQSRRYAELLDSQQNSAYAINSVDIEPVEEDDSQNRLYAE